MRGAGDHLVRGAASLRQAGGSWAFVLALAAFIAAAGATWAAAWLPASGLAAYGLLLGRAGLGLSRWRRPASAQAIGVREMVFGALVVLALAFG